MGIFDRLFSVMGFERKAAAKPQYPEWLLAGADSYRQSLVADLGTGPDSIYPKLSAIASAVDMVANGVSQAVFGVSEYSAEGEESSDIPNHPFEQLLRRPNPLQSRGELLRDWAAWYKLTGNGYLWLNRPSAAAAPAELWVLPSNRVMPIPDGKMYLKGYTVDTGSSKIALEPWEVCHVKTFNPANPYVGLSSIESLFTISKTDIAQQRWNLNLFADDNAKLPGMLAFADRYDDTEWERMRNEGRQQWGGTRRGGPMWLRGVGAGGVQWLQMAASQKDMEFLEGRKATKFEIWERLCPGLASVLDPNATEANATAGKAIMLEYAVWPVCNQMAEKITNDILPVYGEGLEGAFDDIRETNRLIDLQEQQAFEQTHTVNEIRAEYYGDDDLDDGDVPVDVWKRGGKSATPAPAFGAPTMTPEAEPEPEAEAEPAEIKTPDAPDDVAAPEPPKAADLAKWQSKTVKAAAAGKRPADVRFVSATIPDAEQARIRAGLQKAVTVADVRAVFAGALVGPSLADVLAELRATRARLDA